MNLSPKNQTIINALFPGVYSDRINLKKLHVLVEEGIVGMSEAYRLGGKEVSRLFSLHNKFKQSELVN